jgi:hypothetical protein
LVRVLEKGKCGQRGGLNRRDGVAEGARIKTNQRGLFGDLRGVLAVFVLNSPGGMIGGALSSAAGGGRFGTGSGRGGKWVMGRFGNQAEVLPPALLSLSIFFPFPFSDFF